jgi:hypothetical protein
MTFSFKQTHRSFHELFAYYTYSSIPVSTLLQHYKICCRCKQCSLDIISPCLNISFIYLSHKNEEMDKASKVVGTA